MMMMMTKRSTRSSVHWYLCISLDGQCPTIVFTDLLDIDYWPQQQQQQDQDVKYNCLCLCARGESISKS